MNKLKNFHNIKLECADATENDALIEDYEGIGRLFFESVKNSKRCRVYRYMPIKKYHLDTLKKNVIYLSELSEMDDIYEGIPSDITAGPISTQEAKYVGKACLIKSFCERNNDHRMWSFYADRHKGMCIEYDLKMLAERIPWCEDDMNPWKHFFPVHYSSNRIPSSRIHSIVNEMKNMEREEKIGREHDVKGYIVEIYPLCLNKPKCWEFEREWRLIYTRELLYDRSTKKGKDGINETRELFFPCVSGIYLGYRIDESDKKLLKDIARSLGVPIWEEELSNTDYRIRFRKADMTIEDNI